MPPSKKPPLTPEELAAKRDRTRSKTLARKRRQRERMSADSRKRVELTISEETLKLLDWAGAVTGGSAKEQAEYLLLVTAEAHTQRLRDLLVQCGELWRKAEPYMPYARHLQTPGQVVRIIGREFRADDWLSIQAELSAMRESLRVRRRWDADRANRFMRRAAAHLDEYRKKVH